ncbi:hypothetical protein Q5P01_001908 [Channa striata]|uniref:Uncharacterized protein n=1 Tax=Channa striata TaxID=64152 RepID=A0AA88NN92_CHASR|nr:hypothetical protein Q5P01_001908 [Channa striata]
MAQELELSDYGINHQIGKTGTNSGGTKRSETERRLLGIGILILGVLCIIQSTLNITLRVAVDTKEDRDPFPFNSSIIADLCQIDQSQQNSSQLCSGCNALLRRLLRRCEAFEKELDISKDLVIQPTEGKTGKDNNPEDSGSGSLEEFLDVKD